MQQENIEYHRHQLVSTLGQAAESLRNAAAMAEGFAALVQHAAFAPQQAGINPLGMFQMFAPPQQPHQGQSLALSGPPQTSAGEGTGPRRRGPARAASPVEEDAEGDGKKKRKRAVVEKKVKDPNAPKRPPSAYLIFQNHVRKEMQLRHPGIPYHDVLSKISERWSKMSDPEKKVYTDQMLEQKVKFVELKTAYEAAQLAEKNGIVPAEPATPKTAAPAAAVPAPAPTPAPAAIPAVRESESDEEASETSSPAAVNAAVAVSASSTDATSDEEEEDEESSSGSEEEEEAPQPAPKKAKQEKAKPKGPAANAKAAAASRPAKDEEKERRKRDKKAMKE